VDLANALKEYPAGSEVVAIEVEPEVELRGLFVPSQANAPVVLHLLESSGSVAARWLHFAPVTRQLADLGYSSLLVDYTGVGLSQGAPSVANLERDARAMWDEALRRAGGDPRHVYLRATSLGTIAAALLLESGARPAAMVWIAPVMPGSATSRFASAFHGWFLGWAAAAIYRDIADVDLVAVLKSAQVPGLVICSAQDVLLTDGERDAIAAASSPAARYRLRGGGHIQIAYEAHALLREEMQLFVPCCTPEALAARVNGVLAALPPDAAARFPEDSPEREQLARLCTMQRGDPAPLVAAAALSIPRTSIAARMLWLVARNPYPTLDFAELCSVLSLDDPAGELPIDLIERASSFIDAASDLGVMRRTFTASQIAAAGLAGGERAAELDASRSVETAGERFELKFDGRELFDALLARGLSMDAAERQFIRIALKSRRIPDRLTAGARIEVKEGLEWRALEMDPAKLPVEPTSWSMDLENFESGPTRRRDSTSPLD
jgi:pimeloyl-ACP methyl ester carboxylesterase